MALMMGTLYAALRQTNIPEELARKAAEEVASYENRIVGIERDLTILKWMVGTNIGLTLLVLGKVLL